MADQFPKPWVTDGVIEHLRRGWAKIPFSGKRGHYWVEDDTPPAECTVIAEGGRVRYYVALCGFVALTRPHAPALAVGSWPKCHRCAKKLKAATEGGDHG